MLVWLNGEILEDSQAGIAPFDRGLTLADGLYETIKLSVGKALYLDRHLARLQEGLRVLGFAVELARIADGIGALPKAAAVAQGVLRLTVTRGQGPRGMAPPANPTATLLLTLAPQAAALPPAKVVQAAVTRRNEHSPLSRIKSLSQLDSILAKMEASGKGADDAILLNGAGRVTEATSSNLFVLIDGEVLTPPLADGVLPGIARALILEAGLVSERSLTPNDLWRADAMVLSNAVALREVASFEARALDSHALLAKLSAAIPG